MAGKLTPAWTIGNRLVGLDPVNRRLWVAGQRLHHGATGMALLSVAAAQLLVNREPNHRSRRLAWLIAGGALCAHDWKDRSVWFQRGPQD